jgi:uroporphyrinogen-III synthase
MTLNDVRILVPPSRVDLHPLAGMLRRRGADVLELPAIEPGPPDSFDSMDAARSELERFDWVVFVGSDSVRCFLDREPAAAERIRGRLVALGAGTRKALARRDFEIAFAPTRHVGADVADALGEVGGAEVLLVRRQGAGRDLPEVLAARGARVVEADGYAMRILATEEDREAILEAPLDGVALGNPSAARFLARAIELWGLGPQAFDGAMVAAAGKVTAREARVAGLEPTLVSKGRIIDLAKAIEHRFAGEGRNG